MVDLASLMLLISFFGLKIAIAYVVVGLILAVIGGTLIEKFRLEKYVEGYVREIENVDAEVPEMTRKDLAIWAAIHNWIPQSFIR